jgi:hypothetical protein
MEQGSSLSCHDGHISQRTHVVSRPATAVDKELLASAGERTMGLLRRLAVASSRYRE